MIRAVGFDLGDTLIEYQDVPLDWQQHYPVALAAVSSLWTDLPSPESLVAGADALRRYNTRVTARIEEVDHVAVFGDVLAAMGAPGPDCSSLVDPAADAFFAVFQQRVQAFPDTHAVIGELRARGLGVGVLTDVPYGMPRRLANADLLSTDLGSLADNMLTSVEVGRRKPDSLGFAQLAAALGCSPDEMLFVGNERKDVDGALAAGMRAVLVWRADAVAPQWGQHHCVSALGGLLDLAAPLRTVEQALQRRQGAR